MQHYVILITGFWFFLAQMVIWTPFTEVIWIVLSSKTNTALTVTLQIFATRTINIFLRGCLLVWGKPVIKYGNEIILSQNSWKLCFGIYLCSQIKKSTYLYFIFVISLGCKINMEYGFCRIFWNKPKRI